MVHRQILDWDSAYTNGANIPGGSAWPAAWVEPAARFRRVLAEEGRARLDLSYGDGERNRLDLFLPEGPATGLVVFVHGGYWMALDKSYWSHLAQGSLARGYAVAMPSYRLCPDVRIGDITGDIARAIAFVAGEVGGPICLTGHSAGGHLVTRMVSQGSPLPAEVRARVRHTLSISGVHDLRPIMRTAMNKTLLIDGAEAERESPVLLRPAENVRLTCWVGGAERAEFRRQNELLGNIWTGLGASTMVFEEPDRHHFNVIDGLGDPDHALTRTLLGIEG